MSTTARPATIDDLYAVEGKAELVNGKIVYMSPTRCDQGRARDKIFASLLHYEKQLPSGRAVGDNKGFRVHLPHRKSFSPDAAFYLGPPTGMRFFEGAPVFAIEVRSEGDYGPKANEAIEAKRADYFAAGTQVIWDVDILSDDVVKSYRADSPETPAVYRRGEIANAEPAVPGWRMPVNEMFE
jgi:Uma2 family endonuclease